MDIRLLKPFAAVYEEQSISRAAERNFVSQPALSNAVRHLEEELGCLLFHRSKRGVTPIAFSNNRNEHGKLDFRTRRNDE